MRSVLSNLSSPLSNTKRKRRTNFACESLEASEMPAASLIGIKLSGVYDWSADRMFADAMKSARRPSDLYSHSGLAAD